MLEDWIGRICAADIAGDRALRGAIAQDAPAGLVDQLRSAGLDNGSWAATSLESWQQGLAAIVEEVSPRDRKLRVVKGKTVTDAAGVGSRVVKVEGDRLLLADGRSVSIEEVALPPLIDANLSDILSWLRDLPQSWERDRQIPPSEAWPVLVCWNQLNPAERDALRRELTDKETSYWKEANHLWRQRQQQDQPQNRAAA